MSATPDDKSGVRPANVVIDLSDDADGWFARVAGLHTVVRALLSLQYGGVTSVTLVGDRAARAETLFGSHPNAKLTLSLADNLPESDGLLLFRTPVVFFSSTARTLCQRAQEHGFEVTPELAEEVSGYLAGARNATERRDAAREIRRSCRKPMFQSGIASVTILQPIGLQLCRAIGRTPLTPNMLTIFGFILGLAALPLLWHGGRVEIVIAAVLLFINNIFDQIDGQLARMKYLFSPLGERLDHGLDTLYKGLLLAPMGMGLYHATGQEIWMICGWVGSGARLTYTGTIYYYLWRFGNDKSTTTNVRFWYRLGTKERPKKPEAPTGIKVKYFFRKDFMHTFYFVFGLFYSLEVPFLWASAGGIADGAVALIQLTFFHNRVQFQDVYLGDV